MAGYFLGVNVALGGTLDSHDFWLLIIWGFEPEGHPFINGNVSIG